MSLTQTNHGELFYKLAMSGSITKTAERVFNEAFVSELTKLANEEKHKDPEWADRVGKFIGLSIGVGLGAGLGNLAATRIGNIKDPKLKTLASLAGGAISGGLALSVIPKIQAKTKEVSDTVIYGKKKEAK